MIEGQAHVLKQTFTGDSTIVIPKGHAITYGIYMQETANHAMSGSGIRIGTTAGGNDVLTATAIGALALVTVKPKDAGLLLFSMTADQTLFISATVGWNGASVNMQLPIACLSG